MAQIKLTEEGTKYLTFLHELDNFSSKVADVVSKELPEGGEEYEGKRAEVYNAFNTAREYIKGLVLADLSEQMEYEDGKVIYG